ncbi:MAG TPA: PAS domain S-box protein, partial [Pricia sp.]|nr:PAS domain S-box protein [Pricia sp.]
LPDTPEALRKIYSDCLKGASNSNTGRKFIAANGAITWLSWKINSWKDENGEIKGLIITLEDNTETKRREELLIKAQKVARIGAWEVDLFSDRVYWTQITKEIHEVPQNYVPSLETGINFYKKGEHRDNITRLVSDAISNGTSWDTELILVTAKGNEVWVRAKGEVEIVDNKPVRIYGTFQDIDEKKRIALSYKAVTDKLTAATLGANFGIFNFDIVNNVLDWDESMYRIYGVDKNDFTGEYEAWRSGLHPDDIERCDTEVAMAISGEKNFDSEFRIVWPNGEIRHIRGIIVTQRDADDNAITMTGTNWDITELKIAQLKLKNSEESFQAAFESSNIGMAMVGLDGKWMKVNQSLCISLGYSETDLMQMNFQEITHPDDLHKDLELLNELIEGKREGYQIEKRYHHKNGHMVYVILAVTAVRKISGKLSHFISQIMDISPRINAEKKLNRLVDVTTEQNDSLLNFAHIVSHNLRSHSSNLSMLSGFLSTEKNESERKNLLNMLRDASESLNETVLHLNEVVQVKVDALDKIKRVNLYRTIMSVKKNLGLLLENKNAVCHVDIDKNLKIRGIPAYLDSIFLNLLTNSIKYSSPERTPVIKIVSAQIEDKTVLTFSDNGLGIDLKRHGDKLFGMYKTFHRNKDAKGIGLFITKNQIEAMNGSIEVESTVDVGTTFKLYFDSGFP